MKAVLLTVLVLFGLIGLIALLSGCVEDQQDGKLPITCSDLNGIICQPNETCVGQSQTTDDAPRCCLGKCERTPELPDCISGDNSCPAGCNYENDSDCIKPEYVAKFSLLDENSNVIGQATVGENEDLNKYFHDITKSRALENSLTVLQIDANTVKLRGLRTEYLEGSRIYNLEGTSNQKLELHIASVGQVSGPNYWARLVLWDQNGNLIDEQKVHGEDVFPEKAKLYNLFHDENNNLVLKTPLILKSVELNPTTSMGTTTFLGETTEHTAGETIQGLDGAGTYQGKKLQLRVEAIQNKNS